MKFLVIIILNFALGLILTDSFATEIKTVNKIDTQSQKRVAILISSYAEVGKENLSYDLEELAQAYLVLMDNGIKIDIASPKGGAVMVKNNKDDLLYIQRFKKQTPALKQLMSTIASKDLVYDNYDGLLIVGGNGAMFDLPIDVPTQKFITHIANSNKPLAAVCHGPAALVNIKTNDNKYLVAGKRINSFTSAEDGAFGGDMIESFPFLLEDKLKQHGAIFVKNKPMLPYVSVDQNLITAQNPGSVARAAEALVVKLGLKVKNRQLYKDEATLELLSQARVNGAFLIDIELTTNPDKYDINYLALYGFYSYGLAQSIEDKLTELEMMQTIAGHFSHPMYLSNLIKAQLDQGFKQKAKNNFAQLKATFPEHDATKQTLMLFE